MRQEDAPQDNIAIYRGGKKALYTLSDEGKYAITPSSGWSVEEMATMQAVGEFERLEAEAYESFLHEESSALGVWMYRRRMSLATLSECSGFWKWQVKRHLRAKTFSTLSAKKIKRYCEVLDVSIEELYHPKGSE